MIRFFIISLLLLTLSPFSIAETNTTRFIYSSLDFYIPSNPTVVGSKAGYDNFVFFRYGDEKGKRFLAFSNMTNDKSVNYGCSAENFYAKLIDENKDYSCNKTEIESFKKYFASNSETGKWNGDNFTSYYFYNIEKSFLFIFKDNTSIKIDTNFLSLNELKDIVRNYVTH